MGLDDRMHYSRAEAGCQGLKFMASKSFIEVAVNYKIARNGN